MAPTRLWVVRKGATPAFPGQRGFVGGAMGDDAVILERVESEAGAAALQHRPRRPFAVAMAGAGEFDPFKD